MAGFDGRRDIPPPDPDSLWTEEGQEYDLLWRGASMTFEERLQWNQEMAELFLPDPASKTLPNPADEDDASD
jgi:hypothetical protein